MHQKNTHFRIALVLCLCTALWFALGGVVKIFIAKSSGKTIEMVVCSGSGIKKVYVTMPAAEPATHEVSVKHCGNAPLALASEEWRTPKNLAYVAPSTPSPLNLSEGVPSTRSWLRNGRPPPGRAPPALQLA